MIRRFLVYLRNWPASTEETEAGPLSSRDWRMISMQEKKEGINSLRC